MEKAKTKPEDIRVAGLKAKLAAAKTPLQKANFKLQLDVLAAGKDATAIVKLKTEYNAAKAKIRADEKAAAEKAAQESSQS